MPLSALAPTGNRVKFGVSEEKLESFFPNYTLSPCASGTAALAMAIQQASFERDVQQPEVILPAYGCPDLVAACVFAKVKPILVDLKASTPWMDLDLLASAISPNTVAVVAVTFLGIRERLADLKNLINGRNIALIEDSAQWCPSSVSENYETDMVILSFGRGKPVSMMGGGLFLSKRSRNELLEMPFLALPKNSSSIQSIKYRIKAGLFNIILHPLIYGLVSRLWFLSIGETRYKSLDLIEPMLLEIESLLSANLVKYQAKNDRSEALRKIMTDDALARAGLLDLGVYCGVKKHQKQLRFPVLFPNTEQRDECLRLMLSQGLGASVMYGKALFQIDDISSKAFLHRGDSVAQDFAKRVLTLPTHEFVSESHLKKMANIIKEVVK